MPIPKSIYVAIFTLTASIGVVFGLIASLQDDLGFADGILGLIAAAAFFSAAACISAKTFRSTAGFLSATGTKLVIINLFKHYWYW